MLPSFSPSLNEALGAYGETSPHFGRHQSRSLVSLRRTLGYGNLGHHDRVSFTPCSPTPLPHLRLARDQRVARVWLWFAHAIKWLCSPDSPTLLHNSAHHAVLLNIQTRCSQRSLGQAVTMSGKECSMLLQRHWTATGGPA